MPNTFEKIGRTMQGWIVVCLESFELLSQTVYWIFVGPFRKKPLNVKTIVEQMVYMGIHSIIIVFFVTYFTGVVLAMQSAPQLAKMGGVFYVAGLVTVSICRELGPVLTALVIAGRIGASITAEIGSMKVNEQIEALDTMAIDPVRFLVVPKLVALFIMLPCLTVIGDLSGIFGGYCIGVFNLKISTGLYMQTAMKFLELADIYTGLLKSFVFALIIVLVGAYQGLKTRGGAVGVGQATTVSVVTSFILVIIADAILTSIFFFSDF
ncbi:MAG: phospholipid/cholesterol/gamma-HCH transport system permease protein [Candidatus Omnitrophota bacterium]|jgi:phospholipid/cholesterol/gamma-HCH transport system permease protein